MSVTQAKPKTLPEGLTVIFLYLGAIFTGSWAISTLWSWFIVPLGAPSIGLSHAYGLSLFVAYMTRSAYATEKETEWWERPVSAFASPLFVTGLGWIARQVMLP